MATKATERLTYTQYTPAVPKGSTVAEQLARSIAAEEKHPLSTSPFKKTGVRGTRASS